MAIHAPCCLRGSVCMAAGILPYCELTLARRTGKITRHGGGAIAQLGERLHGMQEVGGSIPPSSTNLLRINQVCRPKARG